MRNVFLFIRRYSNFLFFLLLQAISIYLLVQYNSYHRAIGTAAMNEVTGRINSQYNRIDNFLQLAQKNEDLRRQNEYLLNRHASSFVSPDTASQVITDSIPFDTLGSRRKWLYQSAKVVSNAVTSQNNFIVISRGSAQAVEKDQGVIDIKNAVVGIVTDVSENYAIIMSLLHKDSKISGIIKNDPNGGGTAIWDGKEPNYLSFTNVRQSAKAKKGDTVVTSGVTLTYPAGMLIGVIDEIRPDKSTNNFIIKLKTAANFYNLQYVFAVKNYQKAEIDRLMEKAKSKYQ
jgi:rod shape-determining protein MreC